MNINKMLDHILEISYINVFCTLYSVTITVLMDNNGRIQDLSKGGQDFLGTKEFITRNKKSSLGENFFWLKRRVKIND